MKSDKFWEVVLIAVREIGRELKKLSNLIKRYIANDVIKQEAESITGNNGCIIGYIAQSDHVVYQKEVEQVFGITRSTASKVINLMEKKELLVREQENSDKRLKKLILTEKAYRACEMFEKGGRLFEEKLTKGFSEDELELFFSFIERMKRNITEENEAVSDMKDCTGDVDSTKEYR